MRKVLYFMLILVMVLTTNCFFKKGGEISVDIQKTSDVPNSTYSINIVIDDAGSAQGYQITAESNHAGSFDEDMAGDFTSNAEWYIDDVSGKYIYFRPVFTGDRARKDVITIRVVNYDTGDKYEVEEEITVIPTS